MTMDAASRLDQNQSGMMFISEKVASGKLSDAQEVDDTIFDRINEAYGTSDKLRR
jgi:hypothetical protein